MFYGKKKADEDPDRGREHVGESGEINRWEM